MPSTWTFESGLFRKSTGISLLDRGFRYGMSVFETIAIRTGRALFVDEHIERLIEACRAAGFKIETLSSQIASSLSTALNQLPVLQERSDGVLRIYATAGEGSLGSASEAPRLYALFEKTHFPTQEEITKGATLCMCQQPLVPVLKGQKTGNYWHHIQALCSARESGFDEALMFSLDGFLLGAAMANVFIVKEGKTRTPAFSSGARAGVIRNWVMKQIDVEEAHLTAQELTNIDECFLTNSRIGIMPTRKIENRALPGMSLGFRLAALYREIVLEI